MTKWSGNIYLPESPVFGPPGFTTTEVFVYKDMGNRHIALTGHREVSDGKVKSATLVDRASLGYTYHHLGPAERCVFVESLRQVLGNGNRVSKALDVARPWTWKLLKIAADSDRFLAVCEGVAITKAADASDPNALPRPTLRSPATDEECVVIIRTSGGSSTLALPSNTESAQVTLGEYTITVTRNEYTK